MWALIRTRTNQAVPQATLRMRRPAVAWMLSAAALADEDPFDLVFLDARHDFDAVTTDILAWWPKVRRPGGVLCGHDFQWQYPGLPMAVTAALRTVPLRGLPGLEHDGVVHLASDGMWWFDL